MPKPELSIAARLSIAENRIAALTKEKRAIEDIISALAAPPVQLPNDDALLWIRRVVAEYTGRNKFMFERYVKDPTIVGVCIICLINLYTEEAVPGMMPCGVQQCPFEEAKKQRRPLVLKYLVPTEGAGNE